ncbi:MAG: TIM barrel protein [Nanoarchaeota archaeon]|nr:TIM barrel protein [Nanoarchaeota archaeon]
MANFDFSTIKVKAPERLKFGCGGIPLSTAKRNTPEGVKQISSLGLSAMELEFVHSVNLNTESAAVVNAIREEQDTTLTCHGSYYINLNAVEAEKRRASRSKVLDAANMARQAGAWSLVFHASYYLKQDPTDVYARTKDQLKKIVTELQDVGNEIWIRPETTGKGTQFGTVTEIVKLSQELDQVMPCVDFAHLHARTNGKYNTTAEFKLVLDEIEKGLGREGLDNMHIHMSGIAYGEKGEKHHLFLKDSDFNYEDLIKVWREYTIKGAVISESPNLEKDGMLMQKLFRA